MDVAAFKKRVNLSEDLQESEITHVIPKNIFVSKSGMLWENIKSNGSIKLVKIERNLYSAKYKQLFVAASHHTGLKTCSMTRRLINAGIKGGEL